MEKEKLESLLIDYIDGNLSAGDIKIAEDELAQNEAARMLYNQLKEVLTTMTDSATVTPGRSLRVSFNDALQAEIERARKDSKPEGRQVFFSQGIFRAAAALVFLMVAGAIAWWMIRTQQQQDELASLRKEMDATRKVMMAMLDNQQSASTRMKGATVAYNMESTDDGIVNALVKTMNEDQNTNVRLAALEALEKFNHLPRVRTALIAALATQKDPVVQISLIQLMVRMKEKGVIKELENITNDVQTIKAVKDEAYGGIVKLS
jgi:uncharacterized membrane protein YqjE